MGIKLGTVRFRGLERSACLQEDGSVVVLPQRLGDVVNIIASAADASGTLQALSSSQDAQRVDLADVTVTAPVRRFRRDVMCTGWNYWDHFHESSGRREGQDVPKPVAPTFFTKSPGAVIGPTDDIAFDGKVSQSWDYEAEVVLVIGKAGRSIPRQRAMEHVFGYCLANDVSQRDLQRRHGGQWFKGKSADSTMPLGPWISLRDDVILDTVKIECELNGALMQCASVSQMAFPVDELISELSLGMTLYPGDLLLTGTPSGIGHARTPPVYLTAGDRLITRATELGELNNSLRESSLGEYWSPIEERT